MQLARENGVNYTSVIRNGQMLGVADRRNKNTVSIGSAAGIPGASMALLGEAQLTSFYNDGNKGTGEGRGGAGGKAYHCQGCCNLLARKA